MSACEAIRTALGFIGFMAMVLAVCVFVVEVCKWIINKFGG